MFINSMAMSLRPMLEHAGDKAHTSFFQPLSKTPLNRTLEQLNGQMTGKIRYSRLRKRISRTPLNPVESAHGNERR